MPKRRSTKRVYACAAIVALLVNQPHLADAIQQKSKIKSVVRRESALTVFKKLSKERKLVDQEYVQLAFGPPYSKPFFFA